MSELESWKSDAFRLMAENLKLERQRDRLLDVIIYCADSLAYAAYNIDGSKLADLDPRIIDSTGASDTALIAERMARNIIAEIEAENKETNNE